MGCHLLLRTWKGKRSALCLRPDLPVTPCEPRVKAFKHLVPWFHHKEYKAGQV